MAVVIKVHESTEYVPKTKKSRHRGSTGSTETIELPDEAVGVTVDYEPSTMSGGTYVIRYLVPEK